MIEVTLVGSPYDRGRQQGECPPHARLRTRGWIDGRLRRAGRAWRSRTGQEFLAAQWDHAAALHPHAIAETRGIADGFHLAAETVFASMHAAAMQEISGSRPDDGCTAIAAATRDAVLLAKNRDVPIKTLPLQRVFRLSDPAWSCGPILGVSSLGSSPCASSGINASGFALADTQVATADHGTGLLRYFLMETLLSRCRTVDQGLTMISRTAHLGGGTLVMADAHGSVAAVELGHRCLGKERKSRAWVARTNHFVTPQLRSANRESRESEGGRNSRQRLTLVRRCLPRILDGFDPRGLAALLAGHGSPGPALCRHGEPSGSSTISLAIYNPVERYLLFSDGPPCSAPLARFDFGNDRRSGGVS
ncbi:MAG: hypothetical protein HY521_02760 [Proteobacteria bacterium]|nr:hypothetical protein [Pseudomonadota bacterium]